MIDRDLNYGRNHISRFLKRAAPYDRVLDIGAGLGFDLSLAREHCPSAELHALEVYAPYQIELQKAGIAVHALDLEKDAMPFSDGHFDVIIANQILEHVKEVYWIFHEMTRVLKDGGHLIIGVPNLASLHNRLLLTAGRQPTIIKNNSAHVRGWTKHDMVRFMESCAPGVFTLSGFGGGNFYPFPRVVAKPLASILPNMAWSVFMDFQKSGTYTRQFLDWPVQQKLETNFFVG